MRIKNWEHFQHYKHRNPPWIKLYKDLLNDRQWFLLDGDASKMLANCWLLAAEHDGELPTVADIAFRLRVTPKEVDKQISKLNHWLEMDASTMLASCKQHATPETETETETETESISAGKRPAVVSLEFEKFKRAYPKRTGSQGWPKAKEYFDKAIKFGCCADDLVGAAEKFAKSIPPDSAGTGFVPMAETWLRKRNFLEFIPTAEDREKQAKVEEYLTSKGFGLNGQDQTSD